MGVGAESMVGLCMERSAELIVALVGILKAGGAYVPLDPAYPRERLAFMLEDTRTQVLLTRTCAVEDGMSAPGVRVVCMDSDWDAIARLKERRKGRRPTVISSWRAVHLYAHNGEIDDRDNSINHH